MEREEWRPVKGFDLYEVSNLGNVRGLDRIIERPQGAVLRKARLLKPQIDKYGYPCIWLKQGGARKHAKVHRMVAEAFIPNPENKPCVNHLDNNPGNPAASNLEWCTHKENTAHMIRQGRNKRTAQWIERMHESQRESFKAVKGVNIYSGAQIVFENLNAVRSAGFLPSMVCNCCKGKRKTHHGYRWEYIA